MQEPWSIEKVMEIDSHIGCAMSGLVADAKMLVDHARAETQVSAEFGRIQHGEGRDRPL
jgi:20S proteasome alpha/beta subunit